MRLERSDSMKRVISLLVSIILILFLFAGCEANDEKVAKTGPLRICIDAGVHVNCYARDRGTADQAAAFLGRRLIMEFGMDEEDFEFEIIPAEGSARSAALTRVRAEIMSGEGPDVFFCACADAAFSPNEGLQNRTDATLFPFPERAMKDGVFLPLDEYIEQAEYMEWDKMLPNVTAAGKTEQGQVVIPISYRMRMTAYQKGDAEPYPADTSFADVLASDDDILRSTTAFTYRNDHRNDSAFPYLFTDLADFETGELLFTEDDLYRMIQDVEALFYENLAGLPSGTSPKLKLPQTDLPPHFSEELDLGTYDGYYVVTDPEKEGFIYINYFVMLYMQDARRGLTNSTEQVMLPLYNVDGGATALVASFGAVNANTRQPEKAFAVLDYMLSQYAQHECVLYTFFCENALPVHMEMGKTHILTPSGRYLRNPYSIKWWLGFDSQAFSAYAAVREQIGYARFCTLLDQELGLLVTEYSEELNEQSEENLRKMISESYAKMQRLLDES